jgi:hypothetical protein
VKLSANPGAFLLLCINQPSGNFQEQLFDLLAAGDVLGKNENPSRQTADILSSGETFGKLYTTVNA